MHTEFWWEFVDEGEYLENIDMRIILKGMLKIGRKCMWNGFSWLRLGLSSGLWCNVLKMLDIHPAVLMSHFNVHCSIFIEVNNLYRNKEYTANLIFRNFFYFSVEILLYCMHRKYFDAFLVLGLTFGNGPVGPKRWKHQKLLEISLTTLYIFGF